jgi:hypothetical protein
MFRVLIFRHSIQKFNFEYTADPRHYQEVN